MTLFQSTIHSHWNVGDFIIFLRLLIAIELIIYIFLHQHGNANPQYSAPSERFGRLAIQCTIIGSKRSDKFGLLKS